MENESELMRIIGGNVEYLRHFYGSNKKPLSQLDFAKRCGTSSRVIFKALKATTKEPEGANITVESLEKICIACKLPPWAMTRDGGARDVKEKGEAQAIIDAFYSTDEAGRTAFDSVRSLLENRSSED